LYLDSEDVVPRDANLRNSIGPFGELSELELVSGERFVVRPYKDLSGDAASYFIWASESFTVSEGGTVELRFDDELWGSTILFEPGAPVELHGTLELNFAEGTDVRSQVGRTFEIFQWNDVVPLGEFQVISPYQWDLSDLYSAGQITLVGVPEPTGYGLIFGSLLWWMTVYRGWLVNRPFCLLRR
jgi:hypothetical protein